MTSTENTSINREISRTQEIVYKYLYRVEVLEKMLKNKELPMEQRIKLEDELADVKAGILRSEEELKQYYGKNRKTFLFVVMIMFINFLIYGCYLMLTNPN